MITRNLYVVYGSRNKQKILPYAILKDWFFITEVESVYCAVRTESLYDTDTFRLWKVNAGVKYGPERLVPMWGITTTLGANLISVGAEVGNIASGLPSPFFAKFNLSCNRVIQRHGCFLVSKCTCPPLIYLIMNLTVMNCKRNDYSSSCWLSNLQRYFGWVLEEWWIVNVPACLYFVRSLHFSFCIFPFYEIASIAWNGGRSKILWLHEQ